MMRAVPSRLSVQTHVIKAGGRSLDALLVGENLWKTTPVDFARNLRAAEIQWLDVDKTRARFFGCGLNLLGGKLAVLEANCDFKDGMLAGTSISLYNRGDSVAATESAVEFERKIAEINDANGGSRPRASETQYP